MTDFTTKQILLGRMDRSNLRWLARRTIFLARHGSHAYGTNTPTSDEDFKGLAIPPLKYFYGYLEQFHQAEFRHQVDGIDAVVYDIRKFFKLAADCNPSIIEVLFTDPADHIVVDPIAKTLLACRDLFISKKAKHTFSGYAVSQLKRIKGHYRWLKHPPKAPPTRDEYGLPERTVIPADQLKAAESMVRKQIEHWNVPVDELDDAAKVAVKERFTEALGLIKVAQEDLPRVAGSSASTRTSWSTSARSAATAARCPSGSSTRTGSGSATRCAPSWSGSTATTRSTACTSCASCAWPARSSPARASS
jgi:hypothetical protein